MAYRRRKVVRRRRKVGGRRRLQQDIVPRREGRLARVGRYLPYAEAAVRGGVNAWKMVRAMRNAERQNVSRNNVLRERRAKMTPAVGVKRRRMFGTSERPRTKATYGRYKRPAVIRALKMSAPYQITVFGGAKVYDQSLTEHQLPGFYALRNTINSTTVGGSARVPVMVLSLNGMIQNAVSPNPLRDVILDSTGRIEFPTVVGIDKDSTDGTGTTAYWQVESSNSGAEYNGEFARVVNEWMSVKLVMYGATAQATTFHVELVQCMHDFGAPEDEADLVTATGTHSARYQSIIYGWWQNKIRPLVSNDIARRINPSHKKQNDNGVFRVLKRWSYAIRPKETTDTDQTPNSMVANLFINDHRCLNYQWQPAEGIYDSTRTSATVGADDLVALPGFQQKNYRYAGGSGYGIPMVMPHPKARRYLIISALNTTKIADDAQTVADTPSFDMMVRRCQLVGTAATS